MFVNLIRKKKFIIKVMIKRVYCDLFWDEYRMDFLGDG